MIGHIDEPATGKINESMESFITRQTFTLPRVVFIYLSPGI